MTSQPYPRRHAIGLKMTVLTRQIRQGFDERVEAIGVTRAKWVLIAAVASHPGATQREIAAKLEVTDVTACRMIDRVCADGLMERSEHPQDRRAYRLNLTQAGQSLVEKLSKEAEAYETAMFVNLDDADIDFFTAALDRIAKNISGVRRDNAEPLAEILRATAESVAS